MHLDQFSRPVTLRPKTPWDDAILYSVYASTRMEELAPLGWGQEELHAFLDMQFNEQLRHYERTYPEAEFLVVLVDGTPAGRLFVARSSREISVIDIALLPEYRGAGIGTILISALLADAQTEEKRVLLHVEAHDPALRLYTRLGFSCIEDFGMYLLLAWVPQVPAHG